MAKVFNSIGMTSFKYMLFRIKCPYLLITFIINLFDNRKLRIITAYGISKSFIAEDRIDQGKTISLLIWRIFYDLLLMHINQDISTGYTLDDH